MGKKCTYCGHEIQHVEIHEVFIKSIDELECCEDLTQNLNYGIGIRVYCPECMTELDEDFLGLYSDDDDAENF